MPIARTLGNCLAAGIYARLLAEFGVGRTKRMLMLAEMLSAEEAREAGYRQPDRRARASSMRESRNGSAASRGHAPITMQVGKEAIRRLLTAVSVEDEDLIAAPMAARISARASPPSSPSARPCGRGGDGKSSATVLECGYEY